mgnify:FL=1
MPETFDATLITIVAEHVLESRLVHDLQQCGARGWTVTEARGQGPKARRVSDLEGGNIRIEAIVTTAVAEDMLTVLVRDYFPHYAVTAWLSAARVARADRLT